MWQPFVHVFWKTLLAYIMFKHAQQLSIEFFLIYQQILNISKYTWQIAIGFNWKVLRNVN
jgi:hypothetical protein